MYGKDALWKILSWALYAEKQGQRINFVKTYAKKKNSSLERNELGEKFCPKCEYWLILDDFGIHGTTPDKLRNSCKKCHALAKYGLNTRTFQALMDKQNGLCAVCGNTLLEGKICIDHDHSCCPDWKSCGKCIRGIICYCCNTAEGLLKSDPVIIANLLEYVKNNMLEDLIKENNE